ncbi:MAG TPA: hypothetical protein VFA76_16870 [Terriglobales bacterium]|nr:hypothetical protein [Terriglobales bacterium]
MRFHGAAISIGLIARLKPCASTVVQPECSPSSGAEAQGLLGRLIARLKPCASTVLHSALGACAAKYEGAGSSPNVLLRQGLKPKVIGPAYRTAEAVRFHGGVISPNVLRFPRGAVSIGRLPDPQSSSRSEYNKYL